MPSPSGFTPSFYSLLTGVKPVDSLLSGTYWLGSNWTVGGPTNLSYSFISGSNSYFATNYSADNEYLSMYQLSQDQRGGIIRALSSWSSVANIKFTQTTDDITNVGDLRFGGYALMKDQAAAWAYTPSNTPKGGDVWIGDPANEFAINGSYDYMTYIHEIGHAIGLKHPFSPNSLNTTILDPSLDDVRFTVMSYNNNYSYQPTTPMLLDILAIQALYGANTQWQSGDNVYRWEYYQKVFETIWDSGGTDTIDASNQLNSVNLDLNEGAFSSIGAYFEDSTSGTTYSFNSGLAIAYGTKIENAIGSTFNDVLKGNALDNVLDGREGADTMYGGAGKDTYYVDNTNDVVVETGTSATEIDSVFSTVSYNLSFSPNVENLTLLTSGNLNGTGNASNNVITGNAGNNVLDGDAGADTLIGGTGNDTYIVDNVNDVVVETSTLGSEIDTVRASATFMLGANLENLILTGNASVNAIGNAQNNVLTGNDGDNQLNGGVGLDTMLGGKGNDAYAVDQAGELTLVVENANEGNDTLHVIYNATAQDNVVDLRVSNLQSVENVLLLGTGAFSAVGNDLNNALTGNGSSNTLDGGLGNDTLDGGAGADTMIGGLGNDTYVVDDVADSVVEAASEGIDLVQSSIGYTLGANIENGQLVGNAQVDLTGNDLNNLLTGNASANILNGMAGADIMDGGAGNDSYYVDNIGDVVIERGASASEIDAVATSIDYTLGVNVEYLTLLGSANLNGTGNILNNVIYGNAGDNVIDGGAGGDYLAGGTGNDIYLVDNVGDVVVETSTLANEVDTVRSSVTFTLGANLENLTLVGTNTGPINAFGNSQNNVLTGNDADNQLSGGGGLDTLIGGKGDDGYILDQSGELALVQENASEGKDSLYVIYNATAQDYVVDLGLSNLQNVEDVLIQGNGAFNVTGNALNNGMIGNNSDNLIDGGLGADFMAGGLGNDTYVVDNIGDVASETSTIAGEIDTVRSSVTYVLGTNLENLTLTGTANINGVGNAQNNVLIGNDGNNQLNGGAGLDTLIGGKGNDDYGIDQVGELSLVQENANEGTDTLYITYDTFNPRLASNYVDLLGNLQNVENIVVLGSGAFSLTGNSSNNTLTGNADSNSLDGRIGADTMDGGAGNDSYYVDNVGDVVIERGTSASEIDTVNATISYTLGANLENLNLLGFNNINATGNALNNRIAGNNDDNILDGGAGADIMEGGRGDDTYIVDNVGDVISETSEVNFEIDNVIASVSYTLSANLENLTLSGTDNINAIGNNRDNVLTGNDGDNQLNGGTGLDTLIGGKGNDAYAVDQSGELALVQENTGEGTDTLYVIYNATAQDKVVDLGLSNLQNVEDILLLGSGAFTAIGNGLNNNLTGNSDDNTLDGGAGSDFLAGGAGNDTYIVDNIGDVISETSTVAGETDTVRSSVNWTLGANLENLTLTGITSINATGNALNNVLLGNDAANLLNGGVGTDFMAGGAGNDTYIVDNIGDVVRETSTVIGEIDTVRSSVNWTLGDNLENLTLTGTDDIYAIGNSQNNVLTGNDGNNQLNGGAGLDTLIGGKGNDAYALDQSGELALVQENTGEGTDTLYVIYNATAQDEVVDLGLSNLQNVEDILLLGSGAFTAIGNGLNNSLTGNSDDNTLDGGAGSDFLAGGAGNDTYIVDNIGDVVRETSTVIGEIDTVRSSVNWSLGDNLENLTLTGTDDIYAIGNSQNNVLTGNDGNNQLNGGAGLDTLIGGKGNDAYALDQSGELALVQENTGEGTDTLYVIYNATAQDKVVDLGLSNLQNVEDILLLGSGAFTVIGNGLNNNLTGNSDDNTLDGGAGSDFLAGGAGNDTYIVDNIGDVISETSTVAGETDTVRSSVNWTLGANLENLTLTGITSINATGNALNNVLLGNDAANLLNGGVGTDFMAGGAGNDTYIVDNIGDVVRETSTVIGEIDTVRSSVNWTLGDNLENLTLTGTGDIYAIGNSQNNVLTGNDGNNQLNGGAGLDTLIGGKGNDAYALDQSGELALVQENTGEGTDTLYVIYNATAQDKVVDLGLSNLQNVEDILLLGSGAFTAIGNGLNNNLTGNSDDNTLDGGAGSDFLAGGAGNDTYIVDNIGDVISETSTVAGETDTVRSSVNWTLGANLENLTLTGITSINATGNALNNVLLGNDAANLLNGGVGTDFMAGGAGNDTYIVDNIGDVVRETSTVIGEIDTVRSSVNWTLGDNLENLTLTGTDDIYAIGNSQNNVLTGNDGNNQLNGGAGLDTLIGGKGNDAYALDQSGELALVQENTGEGTDTLYVIYNATAQDKVVDLGLSNLQNVEDILLLGSGAFTAIGNGLNNSLTGNADNNILNGGAGADTLTGGAGADTFVFSSVSDMGTGSNRDVVTDFSTLQGDKIDLTQFDANLQLNGFNGFTFIGAGDFTGAGQLRFVDHVLSGNVSGNAGADFEIQLVGVNTFSATDLVA